MTFFLKVLYNTLILRAEGTQNHYIIFGFATYHDCIRKKITRNSEREYIFSDL